MTRSHSSRTSSSRWLMKMMVRPSTRSRRAILNSVSTSFGVSGAVGSSMMISRLSLASARAISTICWSAMESPRIGVVTSILHAEEIHQALARRCVICAQGTRPSGEPPLRPSTRFSATDRSGKEIGSWWISVMPSLCAAIGRGDVDVRAVEGERAARRAMHAGENLGEGRFPGAVLAEQRMDLAAPKVEIDVAQHLDARERFGDAVRADEGFPRRLHRRHGYGRGCHGNECRGREYREPRQPPIYLAPASPGTGASGSISFCALRSDQKAAGILACSEARFCVTSLGFMAPGDDRDDDRMGERELQRCGGQGDAVRLAHRLDAADLRLDLGRGVAIGVVRGAGRAGDEDAGGEGRADDHRDAALLQAAMPRCRLAWSSRV